MIFVCLTLINRFVLDYFLDIKISDSIASHPANKYCDFSRLYIPTFIYLILFLKKILHRYFDMSKVCIIININLFF